MRGHQRFDEIWLQLEALPDTEQEALLERAVQDWRYKGKVVATVGATVAIPYLGCMSLFAAIQLSILIKVVVLGLACLCLILASPLLVPLNRIFYVQSVKRQLRLQDGPSRPN